MTIWKFPLELTDVQHVEMPVHAEILYLADAVNLLLFLLATGYCVMLPLVVLDSRVEKKGSTE